MKYYIVNLVVGLLLKVIIYFIINQNLRFSRDRRHPTLTHSPAMHVINTLLPVFLIIALGALLTWRGLLTESVLSGIKWLVYWVGLPALLVHKIVAAELDASVLNSLGIVLVGTGAAVVVGVVVAMVFRMKSERVGTFVQASFRGNLAFVGLPVVVYAFSTAGQSPARAEQIAVLTIGPLVVVYNVVAVVGLLASRHKFGWSSVRKMFVGLVANPLLLACVAGVVGSVLALKLPPVVDRTLQTLGDMTLPLALLSVGGALVNTHIRGSWLPALASSGIKLAVAPVAGLLMAHAIGAGPTETGVSLILLATPTAVASYVLADQLDGDSALAASAVVFATILSPFSLGLVVGLI